VWSRRWNTNCQWRQKYSEKICPNATFPTTNPTWSDLGSSPGHRGGKPASNRLSEGYGPRITLSIISFLDFVRFYKPKHNAWEASSDVGHLFSLVDYKTLVPITGSTDYIWVGRCLLLSCWWQHIPKLVWNIRRWTKSRKLILQSNTDNTLSVQRTETPAPLSFQEVWQMVDAKWMQTESSWTYCL
jgi:hypothetical protein